MSQYGGIQPNCYQPKQKLAQYNLDIPREYIDVRPVYSYGANGATITNIPNWNVSYQKPKARVSYIYKLFNLLDLSPALWLDANDPTTLTLVSGAVSEWRDKSGNLRHATQATAENRPLLVSGGLNGTDVIRFDGSNDNLLLSLPLVTDNYSIFSIVRTNLASANSAYLSQNTNTGKATRLIVYSELSSDNRLMAFQNGSSFVVSGTTNNNFNLFGYLRSGTNVIQHYNAGIANNGTVTTGNSEQVALAIGSGSLTGNYINGDISQIIIFSRVLTQAEREEMEGYLAWSTGLQANLPNEHPYKNRNLFN